MTELKKKLLTIIMIQNLDLSKLTTAAKQNMFDSKILMNPRKLNLSGQILRVYYRNLCVYRIKSVKKNGNLIHKRLITFVILFVNIIAKPNTEVVFNCYCKSFNTWDNMFLFNIQLHVLMYICNWSIISCVKVDYCLLSCGVIQMYQGQL